MKRLLLLTAVLLGAHGGTLQAQGRPVSLATIVAWMHRVKAAPVVPPEQYGAWFDEVVADCHCIPKTTFADLSWYIIESSAPNGAFVLFDGSADVGTWLPTGDIFLSDRYSNVKWLVQHEMLHAILGRGDHPKIFQDWKYTRPVPAI